MQTINKIVRDIFENKWIFFLNAKTGKSIFDYLLKISIFLILLIHFHIRNFLENAYLEQRVAIVSKVPERF